ncbi:hypothetical protein BV22DRAFT_1023157 [Leucogyrophana mollusca]|uniref:Uncharacterized protein n=1 Tax=Leucogyrophana mollusca TaxID=85980 RepID=A0ACB8B2M8_9AGAM|nr:hypothetical protein BV22DRAFT_1023157 [Leucogyrophana mollusca]
MRSAVIVCALVTVVNFAILVYSVQRSNVGPLATAPDSLAFLLGPPRQSRQEISRLRRPTQFIGLEKLNRSSTKHFINHPFLFAQIDRGHKDDVLYNDDPRRVDTLIGMISANDRRVYVTQTISTVIQFRALDFGMELCEIRITLPTSESLSENELSYKTRPAVSHTVANIPTKSGFEWSYNFTCTTDEIITFEQDP